MIDLMLGDCLELMQSIPDKRIDMILCDLPYGTTQCKWDSVIPFEPLWEQYNRIIKPGGAIVLFGAEPFATSLRSSNIKNYKYDWIWNKRVTGNPLNARRRPMKIHENIIVFNSTVYHPQMTKGKLHRLGQEKQSELFGKINRKEPGKSDVYFPKSIIEFSNAKTRSIQMHPTQKPVELLEYMIRTYTEEGETVLDNCMGSGSTGVACLHTGRNFIGIEKDEHYFQVAKKRIESEQGGTDEIL